MFGWYQKRSLMFIRLSRVNKPRWMQKIDDKHNPIRNSIRRHVEKMRKQGKL